MSENIKFVMNISNITTMWKETAVVYFKYSFSKFMWSRGKPRKVRIPLCLGLKSNLGPSEYVGFLITKFKCKIYREWLVIIKFKKKINMDYLPHLNKNGTVSGLFFQQIWIEVFSNDQRKLKYKIFSWWHINKF